MKLRLRSVETKETLRIEVPATCSILHLKEVISQRIASSSSSSIHLSLNRKDELRGSSPEDTLQTLGVTSGDLIFYTLNPNEFSSQTLMVLSQTPQEPKSEQQQPQISQETLPNSQKEQSLVVNTQKEETLNSDPTIGMSAIENMDVDADGSVVGVGKLFSVPCFLRKVFAKELVDGDGRDHKLLVIAAHAVLIESGFVAFDSVSKMVVDGFHLADEWPSSVFTMSLWYTLPEIISNGCSEINGIETVVLRFQSLGKFFNIFGSLPENGSGVYRVSLNENRLVPFLNVVWANCDSVDEMNGKDWCSDVSAEREVFEFWKIVKDRIALPLLIDLCDRAGLPPPPSFMRLPTDLKLKILESLPGADLAKVGCVCSELLYLSSNDDLWKKKFVEKFGNAEGSEEGSHWKEKFAKSWESRKRRKMTRILFHRSPNADIPFFMRARTDPNPLGVPGIIGGDHDRFPALGISFPPGQRGRTFPHFPGRRNFLPHCHLGGPDA
uniref:F-box domain-containing protein n=1 Tax=Davidia involucrata TaxID=16924 RepID=A0A5B7BBY3_DAVIN